MLRASSGAGRGGAATCSEESAEVGVLLLRQGGYPLQLGSRRPSQSLLWGGILLGNAERGQDVGERGHMRHCGFGVNTEWSSIPVSGATIRA